VLATPTIRPDGTLLLEEGYDVATKLYISALPKLPEIPELLTRDDAVAAGKTLETLLTEFPFANETSRSVALSGMISTICRGGFTVAPLHAITAPTPGSGKSYLVDVISTLAIGSQAPVFSWSPNMDENEKRIDGALLEGSAIIAIDNVSTEFGGDKICQAIERPLLSVRRLGSSDPIEVINRSAILANGNNITLKGDITRRSLLANLDPKMERPEHRQFKHSPIEMILMDRGTYLTAALVIVAAYKQAGSPDLLPRLASFEGWSDMVRSALVWIGYVDPVNSMRTIIDDDPEHQIRHEFCAAWAESKLEPLTVDEIISALDVKDNLRFREAVAEVATVAGKIDKDALSKFLRSIKGRVFGNHIVTKHDKRKADWSVQSASVQG
jgi:putative DNA primase/helicase